MRRWSYAASEGHPHLRGNGTSPSVTLPCGLALPLGEPATSRSDGIGREGSSCVRRGFVSRDKWMELTSIRLSGMYKVSEDSSV
jgi:hypothetical protein